jgi:hypothetical protein
VRKPDRLLLDHLVALHSDYDSLAGQG